MREKPRKKIIKKRRALEDIYHIWNYISDDNLAAANKLTSEFERKFQFIARNPRTGKKHESAGKNLRSITHRKYNIFYVNSSSAITIVRVLHSAQSLKYKF